MTNEVSDTPPKRQADLVAQVRGYLEENFLLEARAQALAEHDSFIEHHVLDSTGFMELVAYLEEQFAIKIADDEMLPENLDSLASVAAFLLRKRPALADEARVDA